MAWILIILFAAFSLRFAFRFIDYWFPDKKKYRNEPWIEPPYTPPVKQEAPPEPPKEEPKKDSYIEISQTEFDGQKITIKTIRKSL